MLQPGARLGPYEVVSAVAAGGMGEVYKARDTRLARDVAVKIVRTGSNADADRLARFEQEARAAAALNHPNILAVYDVGQHEGCPYLVTELLDGETLRERLHGGPLPVRKALEYAAQLARGLAAAHEKGIVHRDLKPENIVLTHDSRAKIVDFGLAKLTQAEAVGGLATMAPTAAAITQQGVILGTAGYMAPEQVRGLAVDYRTDIFAFGAVLYEMLCGHSAFRRGTSADTVSAILKEDPPELPPDRRVPPPLQRVVDRCLDKHPAARFQSTTDLAFALEVLFTHSSAETVVASLPRTRVGSARMRILATVVLAALSGAMTAGAGVYFSRAPKDTRTYRTTLLPPANVTISDPSSPSRRLAISPDGRRLAFTAAGSDGKVLLWVRPLDSLVAQPLADSADAFAPFWSPDSRFIGFFAGTPNGKLKKIDASGGPALTICDFSAAPSSASWGRHDVILFATAGGGAPLFRVSAAGGVPSKATTLDVKAGEEQHWMPFFLPDGNHFLYMTLASGNRAIANYVGALDSPERKLVVSGGSNAKYAQDYLLFLRGSTLMAQAFDTASLDLRGEAVPIAEQVQIGGGSGVTGAYTVSENGLLAYQGGSGGLLTQLTWVDRSGKELGVLGDPADQTEVALSPDGARAAVTILDLARRGRDIWIYDIARGLRTRFTFGENESTPVWSPDATRLVFGSSRKGIFDLYEKAVTGAGGDEVVFADRSMKAPQSWSSDGRFVAYHSGVPPADVWVLPMFGDRKPFPFLQTQFAERDPNFSPDGRWITYMSNESGRFEVYVAPFPGHGGKWQISTAGGGLSEWKRDGTEIFYLGPDNRLMAATVDSRGAGFQVGAVRALFETRVRITGGIGRPYAVSPDGRRFLLNNLVERTAPLPITLVVNWQAALKK